MKKFIIGKKCFMLWLVIVLVSFLVGCGSGTKEPSPPVSTNESSPPVSTKVSTSSYDIYLPLGMTILSATGDFDGQLVYAGSQTASSKTGPINYKSGVASSGLPSYKATSARDVAGFIAQIPALNGELGAQDVWSTINLKLSSSMLAFTSTSKQIFKTPDSVISSFELTHNPPITPTDLVSEIVQLIGTNAVNGLITNLPSSIPGENTDTNFTVVIGITFYSDTQIILSVALTPSSLAGTYQHITSGVTSNTNIRPVGTVLTSASENFTGTSGSTKADFLFVVDDSGSMANEQAAISAAATAFVAAINNSGLDFQIGTITTGSSTALRDTNGDGGFTNDIVEFQNDVKPGINGSGTETGIWNAEQALSTGGSVTTASFPRQGASMSVIIMSDEPSQYTSRSNGVTFDTANNIFINNGYKVYVIVNQPSQYDDLAMATGGSISDINNTSSIVYDAIMNNIAQLAGGAASKFVLNQTPVKSNVIVKVNDTTVANDAINGWTYSGIASNTITFHGSSIPAGGDKIAVTYDY